MCNKSLIVSQVKVEVHAPIWYIETRTFSGHWEPKRIVKVNP